LGPSSGNCVPELAIERAQRRHAVDQHAAVGRAAKGLAAARRRGEVADDLLDDVLDRHEPLQLAVLVDDHPSRWRSFWNCCSCVSSGVPAGTK
jgi:hypothetical protein